MTLLFVVEVPVLMFTFSVKFLFSLRSLSSTSIFSIPESTSTWDMLEYNRASVSTTLHCLYKAGQVAVDEVLSSVDLVIQVTTWLLMGIFPSRITDLTFLARTMQMGHQQIHISHATEERVPLFTGGSVDVHALWPWQTLGLSLKAVRGGAGEGANTLTALTAICHTCKAKIHL